MTLSFAFRWFSFLKWEEKFPGKKKLLIPLLSKKTHRCTPPIQLVLKLFWLYLSLCQAGSHGSVCWKKEGVSIMPAVRSRGLVDFLPLICCEIPLRKVWWCVVYTRHSSCGWSRQQGINETGNTLNCKGVKCVLSSFLCNDHFAGLHRHRRT